jgi:hypothetical protein
MADDSNEKRHDSSWGECHREKGKQEKGLVGHINRTKLSVFDKLLKEHAGRKASFEGNVAQHQSGGNFVLFPLGTNTVKCVHSCFAFGGEPGETLQVIGILGSRPSSPFKTLITKQQVIKEHFIEPGKTRASEGRPKPHVEKTFGSQRWKSSWTAPMQTN